MKSPSPKDPAASVSIGRILHYTVTKEDADRVNPLRSSDAHAHIGKKVHAGAVLPLLVTDVDKDGFSGQLFMDGNDTLWIEHTSIGAGEGRCAWPKG